MSILIKGMDKPTDCGLCPFEDFGYCNVKGERNTSEVGVDADCPLVEVAEQTEPTWEEVKKWKIMYEEWKDGFEEPKQTEPKLSEIPTGSEPQTERSE